MKRPYILVCFLTVAALIAAGGAFARDAAFLNPGTSFGGVGEEAVKVDPKGDIDVGDTAVNVAKRTSVFFVNQTNTPVKIEKVAVNNDSLVVAETTANDCTKQGVIAPLSRCSVEVSVTPTASGSWSVDLLMTHNGAGRITRARLSGKTSGGGSGEKSTGLAVSAKEIKPVDFGTVDVGSGKIVRSTLMINDSSEAITIYSIDVIEADNGLQRLEQGCAVDMELAPGASCPVTLLWVPKNGGPISTDLIIRHSGKLGFAVIPVRGSAKGSSGESVDNISGGAKGTENRLLPNGKKDVVPLPPSQTDLEKEIAGKMALVPEEALGGAASTKRGGDGSLHLIGTVGDRALILLPSGETTVVSPGGEFDAGGRTAKLLVVGIRSADVSVEGHKRTLPLEEAASLVAHAADQAKQDAAAQSKTAGGSKK